MGHARAAGLRAVADLLRAQSEPQIRQKEAVIQQLGHVAAAGIKAGANLESARIKAGSGAAALMPDPSSLPVAGFAPGSSLA